MVQVTQKVTREMIDAVFAQRTLRRKFPNPKRDKAICQARLDGTKYAEIGNRFGVSEFTCIQCVRKVIRLYTVFIEA